MKTIYASLLCCLVLISCSSPNTLSDNGWDFLGEKWVNFGIDHDDLIILGKAEYRQIQLRVTDGPLRTLDMKVHFDQGGIQDVPLRSILRPGDKSRIIDLDGGLRRLHKITFWYETLGFRNGRARVAVWGYK
jgi:hypothetical protein